MNSVSVCLLQKSSSQSSIEKEAAESEEKDTAESEEKMDNEPSEEEEVDELG